MSDTTTKTDDTILAAVCPPGWRRSPLDGRPVMPCLGKLLFPCEPHEVPTLEQCHDQIAACAMNPVVDRLVTAVLLNAVDDKHRHRQCMNFYDEGAVSSAVDAALWAQGTVRIRRTAGGWEEVGSDESFHITQTGGANEARVSGWSDQRQD